MNDYKLKCYGHSFLFSHCPFLVFPFVPFTDDLFLVTPIVLL